MVFGLWSLVLERAVLLTMTSKTQEPRSTTNEVSAIILAAGRSERMGAFKPLLPFGPLTVIESCIKFLRSGGVDSIVVVVGRGPNAETLQSRLSTADVLIAVNPDSQSEMNASVAAGVAALSEDARAVVITPVDYPAVPAAVVANLIDSWKNDALLAKPTWDRRGGHPVLIDLSYREQLLNLDTDGGLKAFFNAHQNEVRRIPVNSNYIARDMDTWDDYRALHLEVFGVEPPPLVAFGASEGGTETAEK